jgi:hypothetical protein
MKAEIGKGAGFLGHGSASKVHPQRPRLQRLLMP